MILFYFICYALAFKVDGVGVPLGQYLSLPYPELSFKSNVIVENTEKIIALIEEHFSYKEPIFSVKSAELILNRITQSFNTPHPLVHKLDSLSRLMQTKDVDSSINSMKAFVAGLPGNNHLKGSLRTYRLYVDIMASAVNNFKSIERSVRLAAAKNLLEGLMMYKTKQTSFYDIIKAYD